MYGYECKNCGLKFKCKEICRVCPSCGHWYYRKQGIPVLIQHCEESFISDPIIPVQKCVDDDPLVMQRKAVHNRSQGLGAISGLFKQY